MSKSLIISYLFLLFCLTGCSVPMNTQDKSFDKFRDYSYCKIEATKQSQKNSCGSASLVSVLNYWNIDITEKYILDNYPKKIVDGYSILELVEISKHEGLNAYGYTMQDSPEKKLEDQILQGRPVICAVYLPYHLYFAQDIPIYGSLYKGLTWSIGTRRNHYVVIFGLNDKNFLAIDPSCGIVSLNKKRFYASWKKMGYCVLLGVKKVKNI